MKKTELAVLILLFLSAAVSLRAQEDSKAVQNKTASTPGSINMTDVTILAPLGKKVEQDKIRVGAGMELTQFGGLNIIAPKGTKIYKEGSQILYEDLGEFLGRKFDEIDNRLGQIEKKQEELKSQLEELKKSLEAKNKRGLIGQEYK
jgi:flagellar capping protein FliD